MTHRYLLQGVLRRRLALAVVRDALRRGLQLHRDGSVIEVRDGRRAIRLAAEHEVYLPDLITSFDYYHGAVEPLDWRGVALVDYSTPRLHDVVGFDAFPVLFPSFSEPLVTTQQYLGFAALAPGMTVLDLGAYAGLTTMLFAREVGPGGHVIAVDADARNFACLRRNIDRFQRAFGPHRIELLNQAMWSHDDGLTFSQEGNMGASASALVGEARGALQRVPSTRLSSIATRFELARVDFIKCDVEGAEVEVLRDDAFFARFQPRLIIEAHRVGAGNTVAACVAMLTAHGYACREIEQHGVALPLIECSPPGSRPIPS